MRAYILQCICLLTYACLAGFRVAAAPSFNISTVFENRKTYVAGIVAMVKALHIDGVTFDYESPIPNGSPLAEQYVQIINETTAALHSDIPGSQTSVCVACKYLLAPLLDKK